MYLGDLEAAQRCLETALQAFEDGRGYERARLETLAILSELALARGDIASAMRHLQASLRICEGFYRQLQATHKLEGTPDALPVDLMALCARAALVAAAQGQSERAVTLASLADALRAQTGQVMLPPLQARLDEALADIRARLSEIVSERAWQAGQTMSLAQAFALLLG
jgi:tetratricopeptide (TPR) repeat protein